MIFLPGGALKHDRKREEAGMFCRFGSLEDARPVIAPIGLNEEWIRPVRGWMCSRKRRP